MPKKGHRDSTGTPLAAKLGVREGSRVLVPTDLSFEIVPRTGLDAGLVDNTSASIDERYQGVQFVFRLKDRPRR